LPSLRAFSRTSFTALQSMPQLQVIAYIGIDLQ
jgi:hypothetical protein